MAGQEGGSPLLTMRPIGVMESCFKYKNGTPRQPGVCAAARGRLVIDSALYTCPEHSLEGLVEFSHVWVVFLFHKNNNAYTKAKVKPPRLNGRKTGVFSTRSPYRPNAIGLTLARIEKIEGASLYLCGIDLLDGTPVLDIKPYISAYDQPNYNLATEDPTPVAEKGSGDEACSLGMGSLGAKSATSDSPINNQDSDDTSDVSNNEIFHKKDGFSQDHQIGNHKQDPGACDMLGNVHTGSHPGDGKKVEASSGGSPSASPETSIVTPAAPSTSAADSVVPVVPPDSSTTHDNNASISAQWIAQPPIAKLTVRFTDTVDEQLPMFDLNASDPLYKLQFLDSPAAVKKAITDILEADPRSTYRRNKCSDRLYFFIVDNCHVTAWFDGNVVEVVRVQPASFGHPDLAGRHAQQDR